MKPNELKITVKVNHESERKKGAKSIVVGISKGKAFKVVPFFFEGTDVTNTELDNIATVLETFTKEIEKFSNESQRPT